MSDHHDLDLASIQASLAGTSIQCPSCATPIAVPQLDVTSVKILNPIASSAAAATS